MDLSSDRFAVMVIKQDGVARTLLVAYGVNC